MEPTLPLIILFSLIGGLFALIGGFFLLWKSDFTKKIIIHLVTFAAGVLLGVSFFDLLPEAFEEAEHIGLDPAILFYWVLGGIIGFFIIERLLLRLHVHDEATDPVDHHAHSEEQAHVRRGNLPWLVTIGDGIHNFMDGIAITAAFLVSIPTGIVTALAIAAHEIPQEIADFSILMHGGLPKRRVAWLNVGAALMTTVGAVTAFILRDALEPYLAILLALTAGIFIYIATADLFPEIHAHTKREHHWHVLVLILAAVFLTYQLTAVAHQYIEPSHGEETEQESRDAHTD